MAPKKDPLEGRRQDGTLKPGYTANPKGKPRGLKSLSQTLFKILAEIPTGDELQAMFDALDIPAGVQALIETAPNRQEAYARAMVFRALTGNWTAAAQIFDRLDPVPKAVEISGKGGGPIQTAGVQMTAAGTPEDARAAYTALVNGQEASGDE